MKIGIFQKIFNALFLSLNTTSDASLTKTEPFLDELGLKKIQNGPFMNAPSPRKHLKIYNLRTINAIKMKLSQTVYLHETFYLIKDLGVTHREWEGVAEKSLKKAQKIRFFGSISWNTQ